jgi:hypothetical protein
MMFLLLVQSSKVNRESIIKQFRGITNATQNDASRILKQNGYRLEASVDAFYSDDLALSNANKGASSSEKKAEKESKEKLGALFDQYKGKCRWEHNKPDKADASKLFRMQTRMAKISPLMVLWKCVKI